MNPLVEHVTADAMQASKGKVGRPKGEMRRSVAEDLLAAAERLVVRIGHIGVTEKDIATEAGTSVAMIHYYFKSRDGLLFCLIDKAAREQGEKLNALEQALEELPHSHTRFLVDQLVAIYSSQPVLLKLVVSEFMRPCSLITDEFVHRYGNRSPDVLRRILSRLVQRGFYRAQIDTKQVALTIVCLIVGPWVLRPQLPGFGLSSDQQSWTHQVVDLLERQLCVCTPTV